MHEELQRQIDGELLPGVATAVLSHGEVIDTFCSGWADREAGVALRPDHIFRVFSNSKLVTTFAALLLHDEGAFGLDDPVGRFIPELANRSVLRAGATHILDTERAWQPITIRHLMTHTSGLIYGFGPGMLDQAYRDAGVLGPDTPLADKMTALAPLPLRFEPGSDWEYSFATDVLGRLVEVVGGESFGDFLHRRVFLPLGMTDTGFFVPGSQHHRLCAFYRSLDASDPSKGLVRDNNTPYPGAYLEPVPNQGGGGGMVSTLGDFTRLVQSLMPEGKSMLEPATLALLGQNQLAPGLHVKFPGLGSIEGQGYGLAGAVTLQAGPNEPRSCEGEFQWGGLGGTTWWINPRHNLAGVLMTQKATGPVKPHGDLFKLCAYRAMGLD